MDIFLLYTALYLLSILGIVIVASLVLLRRRTSEYRNFAFFALFVSLWLLLQFLAQLLHQISFDFAMILLRATTALPVFFAVFFYAFTKLYTKQTLKLAVHLLIASLLAIVALVPGLVIKSATIDFSGITLDATWLYYVVLLVVIGYMSLAIAMLVRDARHSRNPLRVLRSKFLIYSVAQALVTIVGVILFLPNLLIAQLIIPLSLLIMTILFAYAIIRHRLFDIRLVVTRALAYILSLATLTAIYALFAFWVATKIFNQPAVSLEGQLGYILLALTLALTYGPLKRFFDRITRAIFYQDAYDTQQVLDKISSILVKTVAVDSLVRQTMNVLKDKIKTESMAVIIVKDQLKIDRSLSIGRRDKLAFEAIQPELVRHDSPLIVLDELEGTSSHLVKLLQDEDIAIIVRLETAKELVGYMLFARKASGNVYNDQDINVIRIVADELAVAVQNALRLEKISRFNETLQQEVDQATEELRASNKKLKALDEAKDEFISMASHQLRTPLTSVKGYVSMALEGDAGELTADQRKLLQEAYASSQRMVYMIADFLNVSRLKTGKFILEPSSVKLDLLIKEEISQLQAAAKGRGLTIKTHIAADFPTLQLDENKIRQVIMNFIDNAIFYSKSGGTITISLVKTDKQFTFTVEDTGIGVPADEQVQVFGKFFRASNAIHVRPDGTGIGLFMAKKVITAHGGEIIFKSQEGKGSTFGFSLPLKLT